MKKNKYTLWLIIILILVGIGVVIVFFIPKAESSINQDTQDSIPEKNTIQDSSKINNVIKDTIPSNWKTYTNNQYGFTFRYPVTWSMYGKDANVIDRSGTIIAIKINFIDTISRTTLLIKYHLAPKGAELYQHVVSQYHSTQGLYSNGVKQIVVAGQKAVKAISTVSIDGKEHVLNPPEELILVDLLDKQQTGEIQLQFRTPLTNDKIEVAKFERLLSTFNFTN